MSVLYWAIVCRKKQSGFIFAPEPRIKKKLTAQFFSLSSCSRSQSFLSLARGAHITRLWCAYPQRVCVLLYYLQPRANVTSNWLHEMRVSHLSASFRTLFIFFAHLSNAAVKKTRSPWVPPRETISIFQPRRVSNRPEPIFSCDPII